MGKGWKGRGEGKEVEVCNDITSSPGSTIPKSLLLEIGLTTHNSEKVQAV